MPDLDVVALHARSVELFLDRVRAIPDDGWGRVTPDEEWDLRTLVNHVVGEDRWTVPMLEGRTIADVGDSLDGDLLGPMPKDAAETAGKEAVAAAGESGAAERTVHVSFGDIPGTEYLWQLTADHLIHGWDVAAAAGGDRRLDPDLVDAVATWFAAVEPFYREGGVIASRPDLAATDRQDRLLVAFGRDPGWTEAWEVVRRFGSAWEAWDLERAVAWLADDAVFESTGPAPDGQRAAGKDAIRAVWQELWQSTREPRFSFEESFACGDRAAARWRFEWAGEDGSPGHVRGVDVLRVRDGKIAEKLSYVKG